MNVKLMKLCNCIEQSIFVRISNERKIKNTKDDPSLWIAGRSNLKYNEAGVHCMQQSIKSDSNNILSTCIGRKTLEEAVLNREMTFAN